MILTDRQTYTQTRRQTNRQPLTFLCLHGHHYLFIMNIHLPVVFSARGPEVLKSGKGKSYTKGFFYNKCSPIESAIQNIRFPSTTTTKSMTPLLEP